MDELPDSYMHPGMKYFTPHDQGNKSNCSSHAIAACLELQLSARLKKRVTVDVEDLWEKQKKFGTAQEGIGDHMESSLNTANTYGVIFSVEDGRKGTREEINIVTPQPYDEVEARFVISGYVPTSWIKDELDSINLHLLDINGQIIMGGSIKPKLTTKSLSESGETLSFSETVQLVSISNSYLRESLGRMTIKLSSFNEIDQSIYIPIIVKAFKTKETFDPQIIEKHTNLESKMHKYETDLVKYRKELSEINKRRDNDYETNKITTDGYSDIKDETILDNVFQILEFSEDPDIINLEEEYKDAIEWRGPLGGGLVDRFNGFDFRVYSNDHDKHFHVIHRERGINARFSFPEIKLINYKNINNTISTKQQKNILKFFENPEKFKKLEEEFKKRS